MAASDKSEEELRLEYNSTLALVSSWPMRYQKKMVQAIQTPKRGDDFESEIRT